MHSGSEHDGRTENVEFTSPHEHIKNTLEDKWIIILVMTIPCSKGVSPTYGVGNGDLLVLGKCLHVS